VNPMKIAAPSASWPVRPLGPLGPLGLALWALLAPMVASADGATPCLRPVVDASAAAGTAGAAPSKREPSYLAGTPIDAIALFAPPPADGSWAQRTELRALLKAQHDAHAAGTTRRAIADAQLTCARVADVVGAGHAGGAAGAGGAGGATGATGAERGADSQALQFATRAALDAAVFTSTVKRYWHRARPFVTSGRVERLADVAPTAELSNGAVAVIGYDRELRNHTSYPSGHATFGMACGILLARMLPEHRAELFARGITYGDSRVIVGAHYPSDVAAGRLAATAAVALMMQNPCFEADFALARTALRRSMGLAEAPMDSPQATPPP